MTLLHRSSRSPGTRVQRADELRRGASRNEEESIELPEQLANSKSPAVVSVTPRLVLVCLTDADLAHLTGSPQPSIQRKWLDERGWPYQLTRRGKVRVARALFEQRMGVQRAANETAAPPAEPDWQAFRVL
jgi:hypothetical protein